MSGQQRRPGGQPRPAKCYNCGSLEHFLTTCPEPTRDFPAGLAAALKSSQKPLSSHDYGEGHDHRPVKRQKTDSTAPVITRYPPPSAGPVVTRYAPPPSVDPSYGAQGYYGAQGVAPYQQAPSYQNQQFGPPINQQPNSGYPPYVQQPTYGQQMIAAPQYGPPQPGAPHGYGAPQPYSQSAPQAGPYQFGAYPSGTAPQQYGYDGAQYGQQPAMVQPPQSYPQYQGPQPTPAAYNHAPQPHAAYNHSPHPTQQWGQPPRAPQGYSGAPYQPGQQQYQQPYSGHHQSPPTQAPYQAPYPNPNYAHPPSGPGLMPPVTMPAHGYDTPVQHQQYPATSGPSPSVSHQSRVQAPPHAHYASDLVTEEQQFNWDLQKIFQETKSQRPADPIACPLPAIFDQEPILPPAYNVKSVTCKYVRSNNVEVFSRGIRQSLQWALLKSDPAFNDIDFNASLIPLDEVGKWAAERQERRASMASIDSAGNTPQSFDLNDVDRQSKFESRLEAAHADDHTLTAQSGRRFSSSEEGPPASRSGTPSFDRSRTPYLDIPGTPVLEAAADDAWAPQPGESRRSTSPAPAFDSTLDSSDPTEAYLASLGVSGPPKPVLQKRSSFSTPGGNQWEQPQDAVARPPSRQDSGYASARGSYSKPTGTGFDYGNPHGPRQTYNQTQPPPPPPPPYSRRQFDGPDSSSSDTSARGQPPRRNSTYDTQSRVAHGSSPLSPTSAELLSYEKPTGPDRLNGKKAEPQRQEDDVTPKMKRRQPKVADAYSRRW